MLDRIGLIKYGGRFEKISGLVSDWVVCNGGWFVIGKKSKVDIYTHKVEMQHFYLLVKTSRKSQTLTGGAEAKKRISTFRRLVFANVF